MRAYGCCEVFGHGSGWWHQSSRNLTAGLPVRAARFLFCRIALQRSRRPGAQSAPGWRIGFGASPSILPGAGPGGEASYDIRRPDTLPAFTNSSRTPFLIRLDIALGTWRTIFQSIMRAIAVRLERPTHLLQTAHDLAVPQEVALRLHQHIHGSTLDILDANGHLPHMTAPSEDVRLLAWGLSPANGTGQPVMLGDVDTRPPDGLGALVRFARHTLRHRLRTRV